MATATTTTNGAAPEAAVRWVEGFIEGWRAPADADSFADHFEPMCAPDVRLVQPQVATTTGREAFREQFARPIFALIPDLHAIVHRWSVCDDGTLLIEFTLEGTLGGRTVSWPVVDAVNLRDDGLATERRSYFDPVPLLAAVATRPRAWPRFARLQLSQLRNRVKGPKQ